MVEDRYATHLKNVYCTQIEELRNMLNTEQAKIWYDCWLCEQMKDAISKMVSNKKTICNEY